MKKTFKKLLFMIVIMMIVITTGCTVTKFDLKAEGNVSTIEQGASVQLSVSVTNSVTYAVEEGDATVSKDGLLTCGETALVDSQIIVSATCDLGVAKLTLKVAQAYPTAIELVANSDVITKGQLVDLKVNFDPSYANGEEIIYEVIEGSEFAEVVDSKLKIKEEVLQEAIIGQKIVVKATTETTNLSDTVELLAVKAAVEKIEIVADKDVLVYDSSVKLDINYFPEIAGYNESCEFSISEGSEYVELNGDVLTIKDGAVEEEINGKTVVIKATLVSNDLITDEIVISLSEREKINIVVSDKTFIAGENATELLIPEAYDKDFNLLDLAVSDFTYTSNNEEVVKVGLNSGVLTPVGHGQAQITIKYQNSETVCDVYVIVIPEAIELNNLSTHVLSSRKYYYSIYETLAFDIEFTNDPLYKVTNSKLAYQFELLDEEGNVVETNETLATVENGEIKFNVTGDIRVTITTDSSLNGKNTTASEKSTSIIVSVNDGENIRTIEDLIRYSSSSYSGKACNILNNLKLTESSNFGFDDSRRYKGLTFKGDRFIYGNGYVFDTLDLPLSQSQVRSNDLFYFNVTGQSNTHTVQIHDLEIVGNYDLERKYVGNIEADKGKDGVNGSFYRAIYIGGNLNMNCGICEDLIISNLKVSSFYVGLRIDHTVNSYVTDINISQCTSNGIELNQNFITLNNIYVGQVGAFAIEMVPDDLVKEADGTIHGTAGHNYNQTPDTKLTGSITSTNFNNGKSTVYMQSLQLQGYTVADILMMIVSAKIQYVSQLAASQTGLTVEQCQMYFADLAYRCLFKNADPSQALINFFLLVFVNPTDEIFMGYNKGNKEHIFGTYSSDEEDGNMITLDQILEDALTTLISGGSYDDYKNYKYILSDLDLTTSLGVNLGEVIFVNESYNK